MTHRITNESNRSSHAFDIDDSSPTRKDGYSYRRLARLFPDGKGKKSNIRTYCSIAIALLMFLLGYFMCYLMSLEKETHVALVMKNKTLHNGKIIVVHNKNYTNILTANFNKSISINTGSEAKNNTENYQNVVTVRTVIPVTPGESITVTPINRTGINMESAVTSVTFITTSSETITVVPVTSTETVLKNPQTDFDICLKNLKKPFKNESNECVDRPITKKSEVLFREMNYRLSECLSSDENTCDHYFRALKNNEVKFGYAHMFFNYVIGGYGYLYECRPLSCYHDERDGGFDQKSKIIVGIRECDTFDSTSTSEIYKFNTAIKTLLNCLETEGILSDSFAIEFEKDCKQYVDDNFIENFKKRIIFY